MRPALTITAASLPASTCPASDRARLDPRASCGAETVGMRAIQWLGVLDPPAAPVTPSGSALCDALDARSTAVGAIR